MRRVGAVPAVLVVRSVAPKADSKRRPTQSRACCKHPGAQQALRRASLALQLIGGAEGMLGKKATTGSVAGGTPRRDQFA